MISKVKQSQLVQSNKDHLPHQNALPRQNFMKYCTCLYFKGCHFCT